MRIMGLPMCALIPLTHFPLPLKIPDAIDRAWLLLLIHDCYACRQEERHWDFYKRA
jgi:hypothetical protein